MTLNSFPRGGKKPLATITANKPFKKKDKIKTKKVYNQKSRRQVSYGTSHFEIQHESFGMKSSKIETLSYTTIAEGMVVLGRVRHATQYEISVALPSRLRGNIQAVDVSETYTNLLQSLMSPSETRPPEFKLLSTLYQRGDFITCYVKRTEYDTKPQVGLSLEPELINQTLDPSKLEKGSKIVGMISSIEDHGYVVDTGDKNLRGFISSKDIDEGIQYYPGKQVFCAVKHVKVIENIVTALLSTKSSHTKSIVKSSSLNTLVPGTRLELDVKNIATNGLHVTFEENFGCINELYLKRNLTSYQEGLAIEGTLLYVLPTVKLAYFAEKLGDQEDDSSVKIGDIIPKAKVLFRTSNGIILKLKKGVRGFVSFKRTGEDYEKITQKFAPDSVHKCRVIAYDIFEQIHVVTMEAHSLKPDRNITQVKTIKDPKPRECLPQELNLKIGQSINGIIVEATVEGIRLKFFGEDDSKEIIGFLPACHMAPCAEIGQKLSSMYMPGDNLSALIFSISPELLLTRTIVPQEKFRIFNDLHVGDCIPCSVKEINQNDLQVILPIEGMTSWGTVDSSKVENKNVLSPYQNLFGQITDINKNEQKINLSTSLHDVWNKNAEKDVGMMAKIDLLTLYFSKLQELATHPHYKNKELVSMYLGQRVCATVQKIIEHGLVLKLENGQAGIVPSAHYNRKVNVGDTVNGVVFWIDYINAFVQVTLMPTLNRAIRSMPAKLPDTSLEVQLYGEIILVNNWFVLAVVRGQGSGTLVALPSRLHVNDIKPDLNAYAVGKQIKCHAILSTESNLLPICLLTAAFTSRKEIAAMKAKTMKKKSGEDSLINRIIAPKKFRQEPQVVQKTQEKKKVIEERKEIIDEKKRVFEKNEQTIEQKKKITEKKKDITEKKKSVKRKRQEPIETVEKDASGELSLPECGFYFDSTPESSAAVNQESSSDSEEDEEEETTVKKKKKKLTAAERRELEREKERTIREREEALAADQPPNSAEQFDRLLMGSPNNSFIWLQYLAFYLGSAEIDRARAIAKRALRTINFREEEERMNIWKAYINLESRFGTSDTLQAVFHEAVAAVDPLKIYLHILTVHVDAKRQIELLNTVKSITGKFKLTPEAWIECGRALFKVNLVDKARLIMQRALQTLPATEHVNFTVRFALLENKCGNIERARTLFDEIVSSYPKRVDVWSSYVDMLVKAADFNAAKKVLEKAVVQQLSPKLMKTLFTKYCHFEEQHGTPEGVAHAKKLALEYVEKRCSN